MIKILVADSENSIVAMIFRIISERNANMEICYAARNSNELMHSLASYHPDIVIMDINCFSDEELNEIYNNKSQDECGHYIVATNDNSAKTIQRILDFGTDCFVNKPLDIDELYDAIIKSYNKQHDTTSSKSGSDMAKYGRDVATLITLINNPEAISDSELSIYYPKSIEKSFQVLICEPIRKEESKGNDFGFTDHFLSLQINQDYLVYNFSETSQLVLLIGKASYRIIRNYFLSHSDYQNRNIANYSNMFVSFGNVVNSKDEVPNSYKEAVKLIEHKYLISEDIHFLMRDQSDLGEHPFSLDELKEYSELFIKDLRNNSSYDINEDILKLRMQLQNTSTSPTELKMILCDIFLNVKQQILANYQDISFRIPSNYMIIYLIQNSEKLDEVLDFFTMQFTSILEILNGQTKNSIFSEILNYINHNYHETLRLEDLAEIFGYNTSYLGKLFTKRTGQTFNSYLDDVRVTHAKNLLVQGNLKTYEIAERVGYSSTDYFYLKFKAATGKTPTEYRKALKDSISLS